MKLCLHRSKCREFVPSTCAVQKVNVSMVLRLRDIVGDAHVGPQGAQEGWETGRAWLSAAGQHPPGTLSLRFSSTCVLSVSTDLGSPPSFHKLSRIAVFYLDTQTCADLSSGGSFRMAPEYF